MKGSQVLGSQGPQNANVPLSRHCYPLCHHPHWGRAQSRGLGFRHTFPAPWLRQGLGRGSQNAASLFLSSQDGVAAYCDIHTRLELKKRGEQRADAVQPARPAKVNGVAMGSVSQAATPTSDEAVL